MLTSLSTIASFGLLVSASLISAFPLQTRQNTNSTPLCHPDGSIKAARRINAADSTRDYLVPYRPKPNTTDYAGAYLQTQGTMIGLPAYWYLSTSNAERGTYKISAVNATDTCLFATAGDVISTGLCKYPQTEFFITCTSCSTPSTSIPKSHRSSYATGCQIQSAYDGQCFQGTYNTEQSNTVQCIQRADNPYVLTEQFFDFGL